MQTRNLSLDRMEATESIPNRYLTTANYYDTDNQDLGQDDIDFYLGFVKDANGPILDLCCGTGRLSIPIALSGINVTAVDFSWPMLEVLQNKLQQLEAVDRSRVDVQYGDMRTLLLGQTYKLIIIALRSFQVLQNSNEVCEALTSIRRYLDPEGLLIIDLFKPLENMKVLEGLAEEKVVTNAKGEIIYTRCGINTQIDVVEQMLYCSFEYKPGITIVDSVVLSEQLKIKYYYEREFKVILEQNHFEVTARYGGFDKCPTDDSCATELIFICQPKPSELNN